MDEGYNVLVSGQTSEAIICLVEDVKVVHKDEYVKEVNFYDLWDAKFEMNLMDGNDGLHEDLTSDVWYGKEYLYGIIYFILDAFDPTILKEDEIYTWMKIIVEGFC